jgi:predicted DsbA family dithiol-disulfide isomerase
MNTPTTTRLRIDFVSDISCPWCAIGLASLERALAQLQAEGIEATVHFEPFELNPDMAPEGEDLGEHLTRKYGSSAEQQAQVREHIRQRGAAVGFAFHPAGRGRICNTFDAHRLLYWAGVEGGEGAQLALKRALMAAYHGRAESPADPAVLLACARQAGLDEERASVVLSDRDAYADAVRERERFYTRNGIHAVPAVIVNQRHLISGGQPPEVYASALRQIAATPA